MPPGYRLEDYLPTPTSGAFMPLRAASETMGVSRDKVVRLTDQGYLEGRDVGGALYVRPAIVSVLAVREPRLSPRPAIRSRTK